MNDLMDIWVETFHPFGTLVVIWDAKNHFDLLNYCGITINSIEAYDNKVVTVEMPGVLESYKLMDSIQEEGYYPFMQVYDNGKLLSDNVGPVA
jgi:hypothetical protein